MKPSSLIFCETDPIIRTNAGLLWMGLLGLRLSYIQTENLLNVS